MYTSRILCTFLTISGLAFGQASAKRINPEVQKLVQEVSEARIAATLQKLEGFETRNIFSSQDDPAHGVGAAAKWIYDQFRSYSPKLEVSLDTYQVKKQGRLFRDVQLTNVVAVLPGKVNTNRRIIISGHHDSRHPC